MRSLPDNFSTTGLSALERRKLDFFYEQFVIRRSDLYGGGHFVLACYAALPAVLTPDLVHKLWLNFKDYRWEGKTAVIHPIAPADLLLSPLVEEIGLELYEMAEPVRKALLVHLKEMAASPEKNTLGFYDLVHIAEFLRDYAQFDFTPENKDDNAYREAQLWTSMSYLDPGKAFTQVARAFQEAASKESRAEMVRYKDAMEEMSSRFIINIVKDPAMIPPSFQAMTSLTSVIRDVLQNREPGKLEEFKAKLINAPQHLLTDQPLLDVNVINIEIPDAVGKKLTNPEDTERKKERKLRTLAIGVGSEYNFNNSAFFASIIRELSPEAEPDPNLVLLFGNQINKATILEAWQKLVAEAGENDDILFYLAGNSERQDDHCCITFNNTESASENRESRLFDEEIGQIAKRARYSSLTVILQLDYAATSHWIDLSDQRNILFASSKFEFQSSSLRIPEGKGHYVSLFTLALGKIIRESLMQITNRALFVKSLVKYEELSLQIEKGKTDRNLHFWEINAPQIFSSPEALDHFFNQGKNSRVELQTLLRLTGYYDGTNTGLWDEATAAAFATCNENPEFANNKYRQDYIQSLQLKKQTRLSDPVFLLVFSDPEKKLKEIKKEKKRILAILDPLIRSFHIRLLVLDNPDKNTLVNAIKDKKNRNRVQLFYYSGYDDRGDFKLKDGAFSMPEFSSLLEYQENIQLFVSNTCRSAFFAEYLTKLGVTIAIGTEGEVEDHLASDFGPALFETISRSGNLADMDEFREQKEKVNEQISSISNSNTNTYKLFRAIHAADARLPWVIEEKNKGGVEPIQGNKGIKVYISYAHEDKTYLDIFLSFLKKNSDWDIWTDKDILVGTPWTEQIQQSLEQSDAAILLISIDYFASDDLTKIKLKEIDKLKESKPSFVYCPIMLRDFDITFWTEQSKVQMFAAYGDDYGISERKGRLFPFAQLCRFDNNGQLIPSPQIDLYIKNLVTRVEAEINNAGSGTGINNVFLSLPASAEGNSMRKNFILSAEGKVKYETPEWPYKIIPGTKQAKEIFEEAESDPEKGLSRLPDKFIYSILIIGSSEDLRSPLFSKQYQLAKMANPQSGPNRTILWFSNTTIQQEIKNLDEALSMELRILPSIAGTDSQNVFRMIEEFDKLRDKEMKTSTTPLSPVKKIYMFYDYTKDNNNELRLRFKKKMEEDKLFAVTDLSFDTFENEKKAIEECEGAVIFYGPGSDPEWYQFKQAFLLSAKNIKCAAVVVDGKKESEIQMKIDRDIAVADSIVIIRKKEFDKAVEIFKSKLSDPGEGFDENFLGFSTPLPSLGPQLKKMAVKLSHEPDSHILNYIHFSTIQHSVRKMPIISAANIDADPSLSKDETPRTDIWQLDNRIAAELQLNDSFFRSSGYDKGRITRRQDVNWGKTENEAFRSVRMTSMYTNVCPQKPEINRRSKLNGLWGQLEKIILEKGAGMEDGRKARICVFNGPIFQSNDPDFKGIQIPVLFYKVIVWLNAKGGKKSAAFILSNEKMEEDIQYKDITRVNAYKEYQCSIEYLETLTGMIFTEIRDWDSFRSVNDSEGTLKKSFNGHTGRILLVKKELENMISANS